MTIPEEQLERLRTEERILAEVVTSIDSQIRRSEAKLATENRRARALTSEIHETRRVEDKALLASDEAVAHGLKDFKRDEVETLTKQRLNPYFARIVLLEDQESGAPRTIEYKLGFAANTDLRIIDWRKAPISKLYYEYKEGDDYLEEILGRERSGRVETRNRIEIERSALKTVQNRHGTFHWNPKTAEWEASTGSGSHRRASDGQLPEILSLITAEQFRSITVDATSAILIQGVAGSGKTTVALHRLAWLLHGENSSLQAQDAAIIVLSPTLRRYIESSLPSAGVEGVKVRTYHEWAARLLGSSFPKGELALHRPPTPPPAAVQRVKRSLALLKTLEGVVAERSGTSVAGISSLQDYLLEALTRYDEIIRNDETKLINRDAIDESHRYTTQSFEAGVFDWNDDALLLRAYQLRAGGVLTERGTIGRYGHIVIDEVQDLSPIELSTIIGAVANPRDLTVVGDTSQNIDQTGSFPGWEKLRKHWNFSGEISHYVSLEVSHRSTLPIMRLADHIQQRSVVKTGRSGRTPLWFKCLNESDGIGHALKWLSKAIELYPSRVTAVLCATPEEAKFVYKMLAPTFDQIVRLGDAFSFSFEEGIIVTDVRQVKGLEFCSVLVWNPSVAAYPGNELGRNLLHVAVTRAEENLCLVSWARPSPWLPPFGRSNLVRSYDMTIRDEEEPKAQGE